MTNKDNQILHLTSEFQLVTERHLRELTGRQTLWRRLPVLAADKKLYRKRLGIYEPYVYAVHDIRNRTAFDHDLMVTEIHVALHKSGRLLEWEQPRQKLKGALNEDAFCTLSVGARQLHCFVEADNGSEPDWQIREKIERYLSHHYKTQKLFRVLLVARDDRRTRSLMRASHRAIPQEASRMFLFTAIADFKRDCLGPVCRMCHDRTLTVLIPTEAR